MKHALYESNLEQTPKSMSIEQKIQIVVGLAAGMAYLHSLPPPIIHRDLKPENVMITQKDGILCPKVIDFGEVVRARKEAVRSVGTLFFFFLLATCMFLVYFTIILLLVNMVLSRTDMY